MKILQTFQEKLSFIANRDTDEKITFAQKSLRAFNHCCIGFVYFVGLILLTQFLLIEAETFKDYAETFYPLLTIITNAGIILIYILIKTKIFALIDTLEEILNNRE